MPRAFNNDRLPHYLPTTVPDAASQRQVEHHESGTSPAIGRTAVAPRTPDASWDTPLQGKRDAGLNIRLSPDYRPAQPEGRVREAGGDSTPPVGQR